MDRDGRHIASGAPAILVRIVLLAAVVVGLVGLLGPRTYHVPSGTVSFRLQPAWPGGRLITPLGPVGELTLHTHRTPVDVVMEYRLPSEAAALREAREEIGLSPERVELLGCLPPHTTVTGFHVYPFVGWIEELGELAIDRNEVAEVFEVPLTFILDPVNHRRDSLVVDAVDDQAQLQEDRAKDQRPATAQCEGIGAAGAGRLPLLRTGPAVAAAVGHAHGRHAPARGSPRGR